jgi:hypothetical protein
MDSGRYIFQWDLHHLLPDDGKSKEDLRNESFQDEKVSVVDHAFVHHDSDNNMMLQMRDAVKILILESKGLKR